MTSTDRRYGVAEGLPYKTPCRVATTASISLSGLQTIDGVTLADGDRVLVKDQSDTRYNGIYSASSGIWQRTVDFDGARDAIKGTRVFVTEGSRWLLTVWYVTTADPITFGTSNIVWQISGSETLVTPEMFGAVGDGVEDDTAAIQAALDASDALKKPFRFGAKNYLISQIVLPFDADIGGAGIGGYGHSSGSLNPNTLLIQKTGVNDDAIIFDTIFSTYPRVGPYHIHDFSVTKQSPGTDTLGNGIAFRKVGDRTDTDNHAIVNGNAVMERVLVRGFPENGIYSYRGCGPAMFNDMYVLFNGNYGLKFDGTNGHYGLFINTITAEGNLNGSIKLGGTPSNQSISIRDLFFETRTDCPYGNASGFPFANPRAIVIGDMGANTCIRIDGLDASTTVSEAVDAAIYLDTSSAAYVPTIVWDGVTLKKIGTTSGNGYVLSDVFNSVNVPYTVQSGRYSQSLNPFSVPGDSHVVVGGDGSYDGYGTATGGFQAKGAVASYSWINPGATADCGKWYMTTSGDQLLLRLLTDAGVATSGLAFTRSGSTPGLMSSAFGFRVTKDSIASNPALSITSAWFSGGSSTTTKPHALIEADGATSTGWEDDGTGFGINAASTFVGNLADFQLDGVSKWKVDYTGTQTINKNAAALSAPAAGTVLRMAEADGVSPIQYIEAFAGNGNLIFRRANTTNASPSALAANDYMASIAAAGYGATGYTSGRASHNFLASEAWTDAAHGTYQTFLATATGATATSEILRIHGDKYLLMGTGVYLAGVEMTAPAAPAANGGRIFFQDNGAGKTQLMCIFSSGAAQQLAIQP